MGSIIDRLSRVIVAIPRRRIKVVLGGYAIVALFVVGAFIARLGGADVNGTLILGAIVAAPLLLERVGDMQWRIAMPTEETSRLLVTSRNLRAWLDRDLDTDALPYGPLLSLLRFRVLSRPQPYAALVDGGRLVSVADRDRIAMRSAVADLEHGLR